MKDFYPVDAMYEEINYCVCDYLSLWCLNCTSKDVPKETHKHYIYNWIYQRLIGLWKIFWRD